MTDAVVLTIKTTHDGRICALTLTGALDFTTAAGFLEHVAQAVDDRTERFVLDLAGLAHLDCAGARALVLAAYTAPDGCPVIVRSISPPAARLLDLLNLDVRHLWDGPGAGLEEDRARVRQAQPAGTTGRSHRAERPLRASASPFQIVASGVPMIGPTSGARQYRIIIRSECGPLLASLIANLQVEPGRSGYTCAVALVRDDPELWGLIEQLRDLALHVVSLQELGHDTGQADTPADGRQPSVRKRPSGRSGSRAGSAA